MTSDVSAANIEIDKQVDLITQILTALEGKAGVGDKEFKGVIERSLTHVNIPEGTTKIGSYTFSNYSTLTSVTIPNTVTTIETSAFNGCNGLTKVQFPPSVLSIGNTVFNWCSKCTEFDFTQHTSIPTIGTGVFNNINANAKILVPGDLYSDWRNAENWSAYSSYIYPVDNKSIYLTISDSTGESQYPLYYLGIDTDYHQYPSSLGIAKAYYSYDGGETVYDELTSTNSINGGNLTFDCAEDYPGTHYWHFSGSYIYFWGNTVDIWVELNGVKVFSRHIESTLA